MELLWGSYGLLSCLLQGGGGGGGTKLNASLAIQQRTDLFEVNISANKISLLQGQSYTETITASKI